MTDLFARVLIPRPELDSLTYRIPEELEIEIGDMVEVTLLNKKTWGIVEQTGKTLPSELKDVKLKPVARKIMETPIFKDPLQTRFLKWISDYYIYPFQKIVKQIYTPFLSKVLNLPKRGVVLEDLNSELGFEKETVTLTAQQKSAVDEISSRWKSGNNRPVLLFGVTGSGKSEVYSALCKEIFDKEKQVLFLVPEVSLTAGSLKHLEKRIGERGILMHSYMSRKERFEAFSLAREKKRRFIIGTRSSLLYPLPDVGLIIVDEEHDTSYKNMEPPFYNARDAAVMKGHLMKIPVVLGSATPSSESYHNAETGKYHMVKLTERANKKPLPRIRLFEYKGDRYIPSKLIEEIHKSIDKEEQTLFFLNRRGFATISICRQCEELDLCPNCEVALTYHKKRGRLVCHHCGFSRDPGPCVKCGSDSMELQGMGIEKLHDSIKEFFPLAKTVSVDRDTLKSDDDLAKALDQIREGNQDLIVGTVMISKGHNFPKLKNVVVKFADYLLNFSDYRAAEKCFQIVTQVAGRAGRFESEGKVYAEVSKKDHYIWQYLIDQDYEGFIEEELSWRKRLMLPPFRHLISARISGRNEEKVERKAKELYSFLSEHLAALDDLETMVFPPVVPPLHRLHNRYRYIVTIHTSSVGRIAAVIRHFLKNSRRSRELAITFDVDAVSSF